MSVEHTSAAPRGATSFDESQGVYAALFSKINLSPISELSGLDAFQNNGRCPKRPLTSASRRRSASSSTCSSSRRRRSSA